ncbi:hypothetical protein AYO49_05830 [Verrucomicrobiaceae bacterium SCGC AG-212-N21]|nr:hypothetical protein AYO49_05830 [Verrucomicrobiaceae bacterium SCGC AG-212-N21]
MIMSFDWNDSPLSIEAAQVWAARNAGLRVARVVREPVDVEACERRNFQDVKVACTRWLEERGVEGAMLIFEGQSKGKPAQAGTITGRIREILAGAPGPMSSPQIAAALGTVDVGHARRLVSLMLVDCQIEVTSHEKPKCYALTATGKRMLAEQRSRAGSQISNSETETDTEHGEDTGTAEFTAVETTKEPRTD